MRLKHITFTGIDAKTDIQDLIDIQREFPIAEFGVLTSYHWYENGNRYLNPAFLSNLYAGNGELNLALHICGSAAHDAAVGDWEKIDNHLFGTLGIFNRIQLNIAGRSDNPKYVRRPLYDSQEIIIQTNDVHNISIYIESMRKWHDGKGLSLLIDPSGGRGIDSPVRVVSDSAYKQGHAGGINPDNVADRLSLLFSIGRLGDFWIDMESGVRTDDWFDTDKVRRVLRICKEVIRDLGVED